MLLAVVGEPGERTVQQLAHELGLCPDQTSQAVHKLSRQGLLRRRLYRTHPHARATWPANKLERQIVALCRQVHLTKAQLAVSVGLSPTTGALNRALRRLHSWGSLSLPSELWPTPLGERAAERITDEDQP